MVCCSMEPVPTIFKSCLGVRVRLRGQKRVPRPPARMTACAVSFSVDTILIEDNFLQRRLRDAFSHDTGTEFSQVGNIGAQH